MAFFSCPARKKRQKMTSANFSLLSNLPDCYLTFSCLVLSPDSWVDLQCKNLSARLAISGASSFHRPELALKHFQFHSLLLFAESPPFFLFSSRRSTAVIINALSCLSYSWGCARRGFKNISVVIWINFLLLRREFCYENHVQTTPTPRSLSQMEHRQFNDRKKKNSSLPRHECGEMCWWGESWFIGARLCHVQHVISGIYFNFAIKFW